MCFQSVRSCSFTSLLCCVREKNSWTIFFFHNFENLQVLLWMTAIIDRETVRGSESESKISVDKLKDGWIIIDKSWPHVCKGQLH